MFSWNVPFSSADILGDILGKVKGNKIVDQSSNMFHICQVIVLFHIYASLALPDDSFVWQLLPQAGNQQSL